jgi:hypothetical protein
MIRLNATSGTAGLGTGVATWRGERQGALGGGWGRRPMCGDNSPKQILPKRSSRVPDCGARLFSFRLPDALKKKIANSTQNL